MKGRNIIFAVVRAVGRVLYRKHVWLVSDREEMAGDNGEAFFKFLQDKDVNSVFAISENSDDYKRISTLGNVVDIHSIKYKFLLCVCDCHCSSHLLHMENHKEAPQIFLTHGVAISDISKMMTGIDHHNLYILTSAKMEREQLTNAHISEERLWLTGLPRFDYLKSVPKKKIVFAFTWRHGLSKLNEDEIKESTYYKMISEILNDVEFHKLVVQKGYRLYIKLHPEMQRYRNLLKEKDECRFYNDSYNKLYEEVSVMISDYSSAISDCAYLHKPIVYYQIAGSAKEYFDGNPFLTRGCFDYRENGFGPVVETYDDLKTELLRIIDNGCVMEDKYRSRVDSYFEYSDKKNCERVFNKIKTLLHS